MKSVLVFGGKLHQYFPSNKGSSYNSITILCFQLKKFVHLVL
jgi:hypothetical protein